MEMLAGLAGGGHPDNLAPISVNRKQARGTMPGIAELDLPYLAMEDPAFAREPYPHFAVARARHPWLATSNFGFVVTNYSAVRDLMALEAKQMRMPYDLMVDQMGARGTAWGRFQEGHMLGKNGADHRRMRDMLAPAFTPRRANMHRPLMREVITPMLDEWVPKGGFDFEEFASWFPITVMCKLIGASPEVIPGIRANLETMGLSVSMDPALLPQLDEAVQELDTFVHGLIAEREASWQEGDEADLLDLLMDSMASGRMSRRELADLLIFLFGAGFDTSKNILTLVMWELIRKPDDYARCAEDPTFCARVIEESMRMHSVTNTNRLVTQEIVYRDVVMPVGTNLWFPWSVVARDETVVDDADSFLPEREQEHPHVGFALGAHMCLGQFIARAQLAEGLHLIAQRVKNPRSPGPDGWRPFPGVWGIRGLPIEFDPA
ncbi:MAG: cytochrome P450 [Novosphingobium sp.]|nr:cytochrome P450 [Novosphingobium sp.]